MKYLMKIIIIILMIFIINCTGKHNSPLENYPYEAVITGEFELIDNPCYMSNGTPCLPGVVGAVNDGVHSYILTIEGIFFFDGFVWEDRECLVGEQLAVEGLIEERVDDFGNVWLGLEVEDVNFLN